MSENIWRGVPTRDAGTRGGAPSNRPKRISLLKAHRRHLTLETGAIRLLNQAPIAAFLFRRDDHGCRYPVSWLQLQQAHSLRRPARFADGL
jgi:hypothetical protein